VIAQPVGVTAATRRPVPNGCTRGSGAYDTYYPNPNTTAQLAAPNYTNNNGINTGYQYLYASVGSGGGLNAFTRLTPPTATPSTTPIATTNLFPGYPYPVLDFAGSDAPLYSDCTSAKDPNGNCVAPVTSARQGSYNTIALPTRGPRIEIPLTAGPISIPYQSVNGSGTNLFRNLGSNGLRLSRKSYCGIFTGNITDWSDASISTDNGSNVVNGGGSLPIIVYRRSDGSGTTDQISNHLNVVCAATGFTWTGGVGTTVSWSAGFQSASGSSNLVASVSANPGAIGYVNVSFVAPITVGGLPTARLQAANLSNTYVNLGPTATDIALATNTAVAGLTPPAFNNTNFPVGSDVVYAPLLPVPPGAAYPIIGITYGNFYTCYPSAAVATALKGNQISITQPGVRPNGVVTSLVDWLVGYPSSVSPYSVPDTTQGLQGFGPFSGTLRNFMKSATSRIAAGTWNATTNTCQ